MGGNESPNGDIHPGTVVTKDDVRNLEKTEKAEDLPPFITWVDVNGVYKPVVRIEVTGDPDRLRITKFGEDGTMLESTVMSPPPQ